MRGLEKNCTRWRRQTDRHTDTQTDGHGDSMTNSAQWGQVGEKLCNTTTIKIIQTTIVGAITTNKKAINVSQTLKKYDTNKTERSDN